MTQYYEIHYRQRGRPSLMRALYLRAGVLRRGNGWVRCGVGEVGDLPRGRQSDYRLAPLPSEDPYVVAGPGTYRISWQDDGAVFEEVHGNHWCVKELCRILQDNEDVSDIQLEYCDCSMEDPTWDELRAPWRILDPDTL